MRIGRYAKDQQARRAIRANLHRDRGQTIENQLQLLQEAARRLGRTVVAMIYRDEGISWTKDHDRRPGHDDLLKGVARREFDLVASWSVCRLGRSLPDLIGLLGELHVRHDNRSFFALVARVIQSEG